MKVQFLKEKTIWTRRIVLQEIESSRLIVSGDRNSPKKKTILDRLKETGLFSDSVKIIFT
jgi:hypothetical protein